MTDTLQKSVVRVGKGRGFAVETKDGRRFIITAAHCLPKFPPCASISTTSERTYPKLLGAMGTRCSVWAECVFIDPVADIAVLGMPDTQDLYEDADAYDRLIDAMVPLRVSELRGETANARLLPLNPNKLRSFRCIVRARGRGPLWIEEPVQEIEGGMSGSPIVAEDGSAIGVVVTTQGPHPRLASHMPGWLLGELGVRSKKVAPASWSAGEKV